MKMLFGIAIIFAGAFLTETPLVPYKLTLAVIMGFIGVYIASDAYLRMLNQE